MINLSTIYILTLISLQYYIICLKHQNSSQPYFRSSLSFSNIQIQQIQLLIASKKYTRKRYLEGNNSIKSTKSQRQKRQKLRLPSKSIDKPVEYVVIFVNGQKEIDMQKILSNVPEIISEKYLVQVDKHDHQISVTNIKRQTRIISNIFHFFKHQQNQLKVIFIGIGTGCQSILKFLGEANQQIIEYISKILLINPYYQENRLMIDGLILRKQIRMTLIKKIAKINHIGFIEINSKQSKIINTQSIFSIELLPIRYIKIHTLKIWSIYKGFTKTSNLLHIIQSGRLIHRFMQPDLLNRQNTSLNIKKTALLMASIHPPQRTDLSGKRSFTFRVKYQGGYLDQNQYKETSTQFFRIMIIQSEEQINNTNTHKGFSLILVSTQQLSLLTRQGKRLPAFFTNSNYNIYFVQKIFFSRFYVRNYNHGKVTIIYNKIIEINQYDISRSNLYQRLNAEIGKTKTMKVNTNFPIMICSGQNLFFPQKQQMCQLLHNPLIIYHEQSNLELSVAYYEYYANYYNRFQATDINLVFFYIILFTMFRNIKLYQIILGSLFGFYINNRKQSLIGLAIYSVYLFTISNLIIQIQTKISSLKSPYPRLNFLICNIFILLPYVITLFNMIGFHYFCTIWTALLLSHIAILPKRGLFISIFLLAMCSYLHYLPIACWIALLYFDQQFFIEKQQTVQSVTLILIWAILALSQQKLIVLQFILQIYTCIILGIYCKFWETRNDIKLMMLRLSRKKTNQQKINNNLQKRIGHH